jgi:very-short-patch-repair endonuclease
MFMSVGHARKLRQNMTDAERALWRILRSRQLARTKFRRQQPIDRYIVDFICFEHRLIIEVDGSQHEDDGPERSVHLEAQGFRIIRFWNNDVLKNREGVALAILAAIGEAP